MADQQLRDLVTTREAAAILGVGTTSIKRWADSGQLPCVRTAGGHRRFRRSAVLAFRRMGIDELAETEVSADPAWIDAWIARLSSDRYDEDDIAQELVRDRERRESWAAVADELGGVLDELGRRWTAGELSVIEEHLVSARLSRAATKIAGPRPPKQAPRALLVAALSDEHLLGLSLCELVLREHRWAPVWLGTRAPTADLCAFIARRRPRMVVMSASAYSTDGPSLSAQAERIGDACWQVGAQLVVGGRGHWPSELSHGHRLFRFAELEELLSQADE